MAKSDKEKELQARISNLENTSATLQKEKKRLESENKQLLENDGNVKEIQAKLNVKNSELVEAEKALVKLKKNMGEVRKQNEWLSGVEEEKSKQADKLEEQEKEIVKLTAQVETLSKNALKLEGVFPKFKDPPAGFKRATLIASVQTGENSRTDVYRSIASTGSDCLIYEAKMRDGKCLEILCSYVK